MDCNWIAMQMAVAVLLSHALTLIMTALNMGPVHDGFTPLANVAATTAGHEGNVACATRVAVAGYPGAWWPESTRLARLGGRCK